ncbi:hypothetical protein [Amycolatopsis sp. NPDC059657]|uniref:hypothetical protein n=1 Tax=Amycolatopsis sp. NPDC059657 TaxID=3346899 RepID=UPI003672610E
MVVAAAVAAVTIVTVSTVTAASGAGPDPDQQPSAVEDFSYPDADRILADYGVQLISGDGHLLVADSCPRRADTVGVILVKSTSPVGPAKDGWICFRVTGPGGHLNLKIPAVYAITGDGLAEGPGHKIRAELSTDAGVHTTVDVGPKETVQVGIAASPPGAPTVLLQLDASS